MLSIYFGQMSGAIYNTAVYFKNTYRDKWITDDFSVEMIRDVDKSEVVSANVIESPALGIISPLMLSGGAKTLMLVKFDKKHVLNASTCGDNCAKWLLRIAEDRKVAVNPHHVMDFGKDGFRVRVINSGVIVTNMLDLLREAKFSCRLLLYASRLKLVEMIDVSKGQVFLENPKWHKVVLNRVMLDKAFV